MGGASDASSHTGLFINFAIRGTDDFSQTSGSLKAVSNKLLNQHSKGKNMKPSSEPAGSPLNSTW